MGFMVQQVGSIPAISHNIKIGKNMLKEEFEELIAIVADYIGVPADAVRRDYYIVQMMQNL